MNNGTFKKTPSQATDFSWPCYREGAAEREKVAQQFSLAAKSYQTHDVLQRISAHKLLSAMAPSGILVDIGCGPGTDFSMFPALSQVLALDIAPGMLQQMKANFPRYTGVCGDAQALPLNDASADNIYSNLALQWCSDLTGTIDELARVLRVGGRCHLAIVADGSLTELQTLGLRVNSFHHEQQIMRCFDNRRWQLDSMELDAIRVHFPDLRTLLYSIKGVGASVATDEQAQAVRLRGRRDWQVLQQDAERLRQVEGLPLTYQIMFIQATRKR